MNPLFYELLLIKKLPAPKKIKYRVRKVVKNHVISTPIIEESEGALVQGQLEEQEPQPKRRFNFYS
jgi:hypothetical protein